MKATVKEQFVMKIGIGAMILFIALLFVGVFFGCEKNKDKASIGKGGVANYSYAQKNEFAEKMKADLVEVNKELGKLGSTAKKATGEAQTEAAKKIQELNMKAEQLGKKIEKIGEANESNWDEFKSDVNKSFADFRDNIDQARTWLSEKIAP